MKSTGWIAVAGCLIALSAVAQDYQLPKEVSPFEKPTASNLVAQQTSSDAFEVELDRLRQEVAGINALRDQVAAEAKQPIPNDVAQAQEQRRELFDLLTKLATKNLPPKTPAEPVTIAPKPVPPVPPMLTMRPNPRQADSHPLISDKIVDPYALGRALFRAEDFVGAEQALRKVKVTDDNRVWLQYLIATCLRKQSRWEQAAKAYHIVAENQDDTELRDLAEWQLENIRWHQKTESELKDLHQIREQIEAAKDPSQAPRAR